MPLGMFDDRERELLRILDILGFGAVLLAAGGEIVDTNPRAQHYLGKRLVVRQPQPIRSEFIARRTGERGNLESFVFGDLTPSPDEASPLLLRRIAVDGERHRAVRANSVLVVVDIDDRLQPDDGLLQCLYGLTPAESRLARMLSSGNSLSDISRELGVGLGTLRIQLKSIFGKTATSRQGELIALLGRISRLPTPPALRPPGSVQAGPQHILAAAE